MIAIQIRGQGLFLCSVELESQPPIDLGEEGVGIPPVFQKQELQSCLLAALAQYVGIAEQFRDRLDHGNHLIPANKGVQPLAKVRRIGEPAAHSKRKAALIVANALAEQARQADVVDLRIRAPGFAAVHRDLELARQVEQIVVPGEVAVQLHGNGRGIEGFIGIHSRQRAPGDRSGYIAAGAGGG